MKQAPETEEVNEEIEVVTPGDMLKEARIALQLTPIEIAKKLNLREQQIAAIEANEFDHMPSETFARGYLKAYAKLLHLNDGEVLEAYDYLNRVEKQAQMQSFSGRGNHKSMDSWLSIFSYLLILVVIVLAAIWWFSRDSQAQTNVQPNEATAVEIVSSDEQTTESATASNQGVSPQVVKPVVEQIKGAEDSKVADNVIQENEQVISGSPVTLKKPVELIGATITASVDDKPEQSKLSSLELRFSGSCWINIEDATGKRVAIGTKNKGHLTSVEGVAPFTIKLGKPDVVSIWLDGVKKAVPYSPKGSVANFKLTKE